MSVYDKTHKFCSVCACSTPHYRQGTNHILHLLLTVFLCGWWIPIWLLFSFKIGGWRCEKCGKADKYNSIAMLGLAVVTAIAATIFMSLPKRTTYQPATQQAISVAPTPAPTLQTSSQVSDNTYRIDSEASVNDNKTEPVTKTELSPTTTQTIPQQNIEQNQEPIQSIPIETVEQKREKSIADAKEATRQAKTRTWTSADGKFKTEATFIKSTPLKITLEKIDGTQITVGWDQLCEEDIEFIKKRKWELK